MPDGLCVLLRRSYVDRTRNEPGRFTAKTDERKKGTRLSGIDPTLFDKAKERFDLHEVGAVDSAKSDVFKNRDRDRDRIREETEKRQNTENKGTEPDNSLVTSWTDKVEQGMELPDDKDPTEFKAFKKAWRGWYNQSVNDSVTPETRVNNAARYQVGKEHLQKLGYQIVEFEHTGSVNLKRVDPYFYDFAGKRLSKEELRDSIGVTTGWTEIEMDV